MVLDVPEHLYMGVMQQHSAQHGRWPCRQRQAHLPADSLTHPTRDVDAPYLASIWQQTM